MQLPQIFHTGVRLHNTRLNHKGNGGPGGDVGMRTWGLEKCSLVPLITRDGRGALGIAHGLRGMCHVPWQPGAAA